ncbi:hypothetical protein J7M23_11315 [Candidatus Sumerlaeota bacterium]|nr:hypothetical protein [Candidatus Sumerlaeota bacterium]
MAELSPQQQKRVEGIANLVKEFLDARFEHAIRINPNIAHVYSDLSWQQMVTLKQLLSDTKAFGPVRYFVCDILSSDDEQKKRALFSPTDQNSIMNEIINLADERAETTRGILNIRNIRTFYRALDPSLEQIVELIQTWIWWDLPDAADMFAFEQEYQRILKLAKQPLSTKIIDYYRKTMKWSSEKELTKKDILEYEVQKLSKIVQNIGERIAEEPGYKMILKRDKLPSETLEEMVLRLGKHINNLRKIREMKEIPDEIKAMYGKTLNITPQDVTKDLIIQSEQASISQLEEKIKDILNLGRALGEPYNYKKAKFQQLEKRLRQLKSMLFPSKTEEPAALSAS